jgi:hypothetical protein
MISFEGERARNRSERKGGGEKRIEEIEPKEGEGHV